MAKQTVMQSIWKEVLGLEQSPGLEDSFFDLGGNSFIAAKVAQMYLEKTGDTLEIADFFEKETIAQLVG
ncbi:MAG: hypothetical protein K6G01_06840 [Eubacterium sp.]|nr:hypothetical protein [Eubacterium sp.]